jgi:hypothetical protein
MSQIAPRRPVIAIAALAFAGASWGCGGNTGPTLHPMQGQVLFEGKPVAGAFVTLHPQSPDAGAPRPTGETGADGRFALTSFTGGDGAPAGDYRVTVVWYQTAKPRTKAEADEVRATNRLPARYASPETSQLAVRIEHSQRELKPLELKR